MAKEILIGGEDERADVEEGALEEGKLEGAGQSDLPAEARVEYSATGLPTKIALPLLVPEQAVLKFKNDAGEVVREEAYPELVFSRLNGADMEAIMNASKASSFAVMCQRACKMPKLNATKFNVLWKQLDGSDQLRAIQCVDHFLSSGRKTGRS